LVVDDSALMRRHVTAMLEGATLIEVCGTAQNGAEAVEKIQSLQPDVVTLDVDMPGMTGLEVIPAILRVRPTPIIMVSSLTQRGAQTTLDALQAGALDFVSKPDSRIPANVKTVRDELVAKVRAVAGAKVRVPTGPVRTFARPAPTAAAPATPPPPPRSHVFAAPVGDDLRRRCVVIGISTGGPPAIHAVFEKLKPPVPPIVVVQHMPAQFTAAFAARLNEVCDFEVKEASAGDEVAPNRALIAPGGLQLVLKKTLTKVIAEPRDAEPVSGHKPSVDVLFRSAASIYGPTLVGVIMTGMGRDGADGCKDVLAAGGRTFGQDQATSTVYGMNKVAFTEGGVQQQFPLDELPAILRKIADG
jgi:two-component system chemotaxis response regulator CheB